MAEPTPERLAVSNRLRLARKQAGLSQGQVATLMHLHRPTISEIEAGRRRVSVEELVRFSELYDVSVAWLSKEESEMIDPAIELAARELAKLKKEDLDTVLSLLRTLRGIEDDE